MAKMKTPTITRSVKPKGSTLGISDAWHMRFFALAEHIAAWSKDPSTKVGAVIIDPSSKAILSTGFNGLPRGVKDTAQRLEDRDFKLLSTVHAELNAIVHAARFGHRLHGGMLYTTMSPCSHCATAIIQAGITCVVRPTTAFPQRWVESFKTGEVMMLEAGIHLVSLETRIRREGDT